MFLFVCDVLLTHTANQMVRTIFYLARQNFKRINKCWVHYFENTYLFQMLIFIGFWLNFNIYWLNFGKRRESNTIPRHCFVTVIKLWISIKFCFWLIILENNHIVDFLVRCKNSDGIKLINIVLFKT